MSEGQTDKYGFVIPRGKAGFKQISPLKFNARMEKWESMISNWPNLIHNKKDLIKTRIRKGIPDALRSRVWILITDGINIRKNYPNHLYFRYCNIEEDPPCMLTIQKDLDRTYPGHEIYRTSEGQLSLRNILRSYAFFDPEIGYCQGMGYIAGIARMYMDEESAFWMLVSLMQNYKLRGMFKEGMELTYKNFYIASSLLRYFEPSIWKKFNDCEVSPQIYATQWFMTIYSNFPIETVLRIWDCFLFEGPKILFRVYVGFFKMNKPEFRDLSFETSIRKIREFEGDCDCDQLIKSCFSLGLSQKKIEELEKEYSVNPNMEIVKWQLNR